MEPKYLSAMKAFIQIIIGWFMTVYVFFTPIHHLWVAIGVAWSINSLLGYLADLYVNDNGFDMKKVMTTFKEIMYYFVLTSMFFFIGDKMRNSDSVLVNDSDFVIKWLNVITWALLGFYFVNICKNIKNLCPESKFFRYLYMVVSIEFVRHIPYMKQFKKQEKNGKSKNYGVRH
jgi:hypothetical protein